MLRSAPPLGALFLALVGLGACSIVGAEDTSTTSLSNMPSGNPDGKDEGADCNEGGDCKSGVCERDRCAAPSHTDHVRNGDETGLDCGGSTAPRCGGGQPCQIADDCVSSECNAGVCGGPADPGPSARDRKKNGDETDVDCGGKSTTGMSGPCDRCEDGAKCIENSDCVSGKCESKMGVRKCAVTPDPATSSSSAASSSSTGP